MNDLIIKSLDNIYKILRLNFIVINILKNK